MPIDLYQVDAFTDQPFRGNPAAVCLLYDARPAEWMQAVAREMNLSETAFVQPSEDGYHLRWFTPAVEVSLCGHATLATAHVLWESGMQTSGEPVRFHTLSGLLGATQQHTRIELSLPAAPVSQTTCPTGLSAALGAEPRRVGTCRYGLLVELESEALVRALTPDMERLRSIEPGAFIVTARSPGADYHFVSRFFAPGLGIDEDPVTGAAHCALGPYWRDALGHKEMDAYQASARGGTLSVRVGNERVYVGGQAVTVLRGQLVI